MKIIDKINEHTARGQNFFSFEFFPPKTEEVRGTSSV
jgi:5,10-methylenetetrahydrofolate reductase